MHGAFDECNHFLICDEPHLALQNCPKLERMDLEECVQVSNDTLRALSLHCPLLTELVIFFCSTRCFEVLALWKYSLFGSTRCFEVLALSKYSLFRSTRSFEVLALSK